MDKFTKVKYRNLVRDKYILPKLYKLGYKEEEIIFDAKLLVEKGRRKIYVNTDLLIKIDNKPAMVISVRAGTEELTEHNKEQVISYARLLNPAAPLFVMSNGLKTEVYSTYSEQIIGGIPSKDKITEYLKEEEISNTLKDRALDKVFSSVSLWDEIYRKSPYHYVNMRSFYNPGEETSFNTDLFHNYNYSPNLPTDKDQVSIRVSSKRKLIDRLYLYYTVDNTFPKGEKGEVVNGNKLELKRKYTEADPQEDRLIDWWEAKLPAQEKGTRVRYIIEGYDTKNDRSYFVEDKVDSQKGSFSYLVQDYQTPQWAKEAIVYQIFIDRFCDGDPSNNYDLGYTATDYQGGDLQGVIDSLDYIKNLGATAIWLSPFYEGMAYHGYHITNFLKVDKHFGDNKLLKELIDQAHSLDIKVILDFVPNHCSKDHPFFLEAQQDKESEYYNWFNFVNWPDEYEDFCGVKELPHINNDYPSARDYTIYQQALYWVKNYKVDGLRMDYAYGLSHDFWTEFRMGLKEFKSDIYIFGEVWEGPGITREFAGELDGCFDFSLVWSFRELFIHSSKTISDFRDDVDYLIDVYPDEFILGRFLDNHDMTRFLWEAEGDKRKLKLAALCQFTLAGTQFIYYGTEVGVSQHNDCRDDNTGGIIFDYSRDFMLWGEEQDKDLYHFYQKLCQFRKEYGALRSKERIDIIVDDNNGIWVYIKKDLDQEVLVIINNQDKSSDIEIDLSGQNLSQEDQLVDLLNDQEYMIRASKVNITLNPLEGKILVVDK
ncbi:alpha-amylase family glycosyl hydrolase [Orenia marismortui]|uniref:Glycosidase n=1 Tax=Orenia marismortui TaxID=46469 RepID=A0A4R8H9S5_9FIRM|nr:alpha-amylase family glycosyl hydrolase [Orenia marismortui]TDX52933.1 glycosidase [Orenia marismortui]